MNVPVVAVDGPAGSGKSTVAALLARKLGYHVLISGSLYRAAALLCLRKNISSKGRSEDMLSVISELFIKFITEDGAVRAMLNGEDVTVALAGEACGERASQLACIPALRTALLERQRDFRQMPGLVADGRDMGTVVFPDAEVKVFLTASLKERAKRRLRQLNNDGFDGNLRLLCEQLAERDRRDVGRRVAPLKPAAGAAIIDTTDKTASAVVAEIIALT